MRKEKTVREGHFKPPRINFRPLLFAALGLAFGILLYLRICLGGFLPSDLLPFVCLLPLSLVALPKKQIVALICVFCVFGAAGTTAICLYTQAYLSGKEEGEYTVEGTVSLICVMNGYTEAELKDLVFDGEGTAGKLSLTVTTEDLRPGDRVVFTATIGRLPLPAGSADAYEFVNGIRYAAETDEFSLGERGFHPFLFLNAAIYDLMQEEMGGEEADVSYALLTGNARMVDSGLMTAVRSGGIAHIFAVSGLHIGILYGAALLLFRFLKRYACLPALAVSLLYCALCGFTVSALRALLMCAALSVNGFLGRKTDMLGSLSLAAVAVLLFMPAQWLSVGFRLSFGACLGLALFSGMLSRGMKRAHIPRFLREYLSASLAVQLFTFPILLEAFGYFSVWGLVLNLVIVPLLPFAFLTLLLTTVLSLLLRPLAFLLIFPKGLFAVLLFLFAAADFGWVLTGFALGSAGVVWLTACLYTTERVRLRPLVRGAAALSAALLFSLCLVFGNSLFGGAVVDVWGGEDSMLALVRCGEESVLIVGGRASLKSCRDFLARRTGEIGAAVVLSSDRMDALNVAAFTGAERIYCMREGEDGLRETDVVCGRTFREGELLFSFETDEALLLFVRGNAVSFDVSGFLGTTADLCLEMGCGTLKYFLGYDIIVSL